MSQINQEVRRARYKRLRAAGFTAEMATKFKDKSDVKIAELIERKRMFDKQVAAALAEIVGKLNND